MQLSFSGLFFSSIVFLWIKLIASEKPSIPSIKGLKLISKTEDVPEKYRNFIFFDQNGQHLRGNNEIVYRIFVSDPFELKFLIRFFPDHSIREECLIADAYWEDIEEGRYNRKLFHMILQNSDFPLDITQVETLVKFSPFSLYKFHKKYSPIMDSLEMKGMVEVSWKIDKMKFNNTLDGLEQDFVELPSFSNINDTDIYFFELFYNEFGNIKCNYEVILPTDYLVGIYIYEANDIPIFEEYSSLFLAFLISFFVILILLWFGICGGGIYLGFFTKYNNMKEFKTSEFNQPESSFGYNKYEGEKIESKSDNNEMVNDEHLVECDCIECNEDQKDKEKLIRSMIPDVQKVISDSINDGIDQKYLVPESQAAFTKLIKKEMKRRNLKLKKNEIEEVVQKLVTKENVKVAVEQRKTSSNLGIKNKDDLKV